MNSFKVDDLVIYEKGYKFLMVVCKQQRSKKINIKRFNGGGAGQLPLGPIRSATPKEIEQGFRDE